MLIVLHIWERIFGGLICRGHINRILPYLVKAQVQACIFTKKYRLNCNCVPMNFAKFFRKAFLQNNADWLLLLNLGEYRGRIEMKILATKMKIQSRKQNLLRNIFKSKPYTSVASVYAQMTHFETWSDFGILEHYFSFSGQRHDKTLKSLQKLCLLDKKS